MEPYYPNKALHKRGAFFRPAALDALPDIFSSRRGAKHKEEETLKAALYQQIGQLKVEVDWLKKKAGLVR